MKKLTFYICVHFSVRFPKPKLVNRFITAISHLQPVLLNHASTNHMNYDNFLAFQHRLHKNMYFLSFHLGLLVIQEQILFLKKRVISDSKCVITHHTMQYRLKIQKSKIQGSCTFSIYCSVFLFLSHVHCVYIMSQAYYLLSSEPRFLSNFSVQAHLLQTLDLWDPRLNFEK